MTFDFFNTSNLAFGSKITSAFKTLNELMTSSEEHIEKALEDLEYYQQYSGRNYRSPVPTKPTMGARVDEIFALLGDIFAIKKLEYKDNKLSTQIIFFNKGVDRITLANGETELKEGFAFVVPSISNSAATRTIRFSKTNDKKSGERLLFQYRVDDNGIIKLLGDTQTHLKLYAQEASQYRSLSKGDNITIPYTAKEYECVAVRCELGGRVYINDTKVLESGHYWTHTNIRHVILYLKPGDVVSGTIDVAFKINYNI